MYIVTFYSFRGGVGRTTALVNVGLELARRGRKVLLVDFDLESPDLTSFPPLARTKGQPGVVEFVSAYRETAAAPNVKEYLCSLEPVDLKKGQVWVMSAGKGGPEYWETLAEIDWQALYERQEGYLFFEDMREQWRKLEFDYVLIDSHAGVTPSLGIPTRQLADAVVMIFNPHQGGTDGFDRVSQWIHKERTRRAPIEQLWVAAGVVEADEEVKVSHEIDNYYDETGQGIIQDLDAAIPFSHRLLFGKQVVAQEIRPGQTRDRVAREYHRLANALIKSNFAKDAEGAQFFLCDIHAHLHKAIDADPTYGRQPVWPGTWQDRAPELKRIAEAFPKDAAIQAQAACCFFASYRFPEALYAMDCAVEVQPDWPKLRWQRASYRRHVGITAGAVEDLLYLLDLPSQALNPPSPVRIKDISDLDRRPKPRFDLPEDFKDEPGRGYNRGFADYSDPLRELAGVNPYLVSALWKLRELDEKQYEEAKRKSCFTSLSPEIQRRLFARPLPVAKEVDPLALIRDKKWNEVVDHLQPLISPSSSFWTLEDAFHLFVALWALGNEELLCACGEIAIARFREIGEIRPNDRSPSHVQMLSLVFWKTEEKDTAKKLLEGIDQMSWPERQLIFSYWCCQLVSWEQFQEDCHAQRMMFNGAKWLPPVLGKHPLHG